MQVVVVAREACAWPVLTRLRPECLGVIHFNRPSHGFEEGDLEAQTSLDEGRTWRPAGLAAPHLPGANRMHIAAGVDRDGGWVVLSTGFIVVDRKMTALGPMWFSRRRTPAGRGRSARRSRWTGRCEPAFRTVGFSLCPTAGSRDFLCLAGARTPEPCVGRVQHGRRRLMAKSGPDRRWRRQ